jgi:APA family basic amino acid/polyamine antiporter
MATASADPETVKRRPLLRVLGVVFGLALGVGAAIGVGILRVPTLVAAQLHDPLWISLAWLLVACFILIEANTLAELSTMLPEAGGFYVFARHAFGEFAGFVIGWTDWALHVAVIAFIGVTFADFLPQLWPSSARVQSALAPASIAVFAVLHLKGVRAGQRAQIVLSLIKVTGFLLIIGAGLFAGRTVPEPGGAPASPQGPIDFVTLLLAFAASFLLIQETFGGYPNALYFSEENTKPEKSMPRAIFGSALVVALVYLSCVGVLLYTLGTEGLARSVLPLADVAGVALGDAARTAVVVVVLFSVLGLLNAHVMFVPRILFALARDGSFAQVGSHVNAGGTPAAALLITAGASVVLAVTNTFEQLFFLTSFLGLIISAASNLALLVLRRKEPALARPYRAKAYPLLPVIAFAIPCTVALLAPFANPRSAAIGVVTILLAYPVFRLIRKRPRAESLSTAV